MPKDEGVRRLLITSAPLRHHHIWCPHSPNLLHPVKAIPTPGEQQSPTLGMSQFELVTVPYRIRNDTGVLPWCAWKRSGTLTQWTRTACVKVSI